MLMNKLLSVGRDLDLFEPLVQDVAVTAYFTTVPPEVFRNAALPSVGIARVPFDQAIGGIHAAVNFAFSKAFNVEQKPRLVQIVFPFVSGLAGIAICSTFLSTKLLATYLISSTIMSVCVLAKVLFKQVIGSEHKPRKETYIPRVIHYTVVGATTIVPCAVAGVTIGNALNRDGGIGVMLVGLFFGLAQVCTNLILGARQENAITRFALPILSTTLPMLVFGSLAGFTSSDRGAFEIISTVALGVGMVMTIASSLFASKRKQTEEVSKQTLQHRYMRDGCMVIHKSPTWIQSGSGWVQKQN